MDEQLSNYPKKELGGFLLLMVILRLYNLACLEEVCICICFIVCVVLRLYLRMCQRNRCRKREIRT